MPDVIADVTLPMGVWTRLTPHGPCAHFAAMNRGVVDVLVKKGGDAAPTTPGGAMNLAPGRMLPPEDLTATGYDAWALAVAGEGLMAVEAIQR